MQVGVTDYGVFVVVLGTLYLVLAIWWSWRIAMLTSHKCFFYSAFAWNYLLLGYSTSHLMFKTCLHEDMRFVLCAVVGFKEKSFHIWWIMKTGYLLGRESFSLSLSNSLLHESLRFPFHKGCTCFVREFIVGFWKLVFCTLSNSLLHGSFCL